jgi:hypothetical protein
VGFLVLADVAADGMNPINLDWTRTPRGAACRLLHPREAYCPLQNFALMYRKMSYRKGLEFKRFDLHVHTPASSDAYKEGRPTPEEIVEAAAAAGLAGIAVTDHQTGAWIDQVKAAGNSRGVVVFPGVELLVNGGKGGVHLIVLFDVDKTSEHVSQFLNNIGVFTRDGKPTPAVEMTAGQVADKLFEYDQSAIIALAHCNSSKGVTGDIQGKVRTQIFEPRRKNLLGAEATPSDFADPTKKATHKRVIDVFDGSDPDYCWRRLGVYQSSDAHSLKEIGARYTYLKVDEVVTLEDIRQCFIDRDTRIRQASEFTQSIYPRINSVRITSGFLAGQQLVFHPGLNSILGAKGSGKSLAIEAMRFALAQSPTDDVLLEDHSSKLEKCVKVHGVVEVSVTDESGKEYLIKRTYNPGDDDPQEIIDVADGTRKSFRVEELFPVLFLSQNEVIRIAEDQSGASQRSFIDRFFDFYRYQARIEGIIQELTGVDRQLAESMKSHLQLSQLKIRAATYQEELEKLGRQITNSVFEEYSAREKVGAAILQQRQQTQAVGELVDAWTKDLSARAPVVTDAAVIEDPAVKRANDASRRAAEAVEAKLSEAATKIATEVSAIDLEYKAWQTPFSDVKRRYDEVVKTAGGTQIALDQKRKKLQRELATIERDMAGQQGRAQQLKTLAAKRDALLDELDAAYKAYFEERRRLCQQFTDTSAGALSVTIREREDTSAFRERLIAFKRGSWLRDDDIERITRGATPREFVTVF